MPKSSSKRSRVVASRKKSSDKEDKNTRPQTWSPDFFGGQKFDAPKGLHAGRTYLEQYPELLERICDGLRAGGGVSEVLRAIGLNYATYWKWMRRGERETTGIFRDFYEAVTAAKEERWGYYEPQLERILYNEALETRYTVNRKVKRVLSLTRVEWAQLKDKLDSEEVAKKFEVDGIILVETFHRIEHQPSAYRALQILERRNAKEWGKKE